MVGLIQYDHEDCCGAWHHYGLGDFGPVGFLKTSWGALVASVLAFLAFMAAASASRHKASAKKWQDISDDQAGRDTEDSIREAKQALSQAKLHEQRAEQAKLKARDKLDAIASKEESFAEVQERWKKSNRMRNRK